MYKRIVVFGEVLFDVFEDRKRLGGAPFNVAYNTYMMGCDTLFLSSIGSDDEGREIESFFANSGFKNSCVKKIEGIKTGRVEVHIVDSEPNYDIVDNVAYDYIDICLDELSGNDILYAGSLALRHSHNQQSFKKLLEKCSNLFLDVNLRAPFYTKEVLELELKAARWLKINYDELYEIKKMFSLSKSNHIELAYEVKDKFCIEGIVLTMGSEGAYSIYNEALFVEAKSVESFMDSVGAGDAFSSVYLAGLRRGEKDEKGLLEKASKFAAKVCTLRGAISSEEEFYEGVV